MLPVSAKNGTPYGLNSGLAARHPLWAQGKLAAIANMGMLVKPTTRAQYLGATVGLPTNLFSHSDQIISMQAGDPNGSGGSGWAGRVADATRGHNAAATFPPAISFAGSSLFCSGNMVQSTSLIPGFNLWGDGMGAWPASAATAKAQALQQIISFNSGVSMVQAANDVRADGIELNGMLTGLAARPADAVGFLAKWRALLEAWQGHAVEALAVLPPRLVGDGFGHAEELWLQARVRQLAGDPAWRPLAERACGVLRPEVGGERGGPAVRHADRAVELRVGSGDAVLGAVLAGARLIRREPGRLQVLALVGEDERFFAELAKVMNLPSALDPMMLRLDPAYARVREDARFERLLAEAQVPIPL